VPAPLPGAVLHSGEGGGDVLSPSGGRGFSLAPLPLHLVKLWEYQEQILRELVAGGCEVWFGASLDSLVRLAGGRIRLGLAESRHASTVDCDLVVWAAGLNGEFDGELFAHFGIRRNVGPTDLVAARQELWRVAPGCSPDGLHAPPGTTVYQLGRDGPFSTLALWTDPDQGLASLLCGTLTCDGYPEPAAVLAEFRERLGFLQTRLTAGEAAIPVRRPLEQLAGNGCAIIGNAACQVSPSLGSGIALAGHAARLLAEPARRFCLEGRRADALWEYNREYQVRFGGLQAADELFMRGVRSLSAGTQWSETMFEIGAVDAADFLRSLQLGGPLPAANHWPRKLGPALSGLPQVLPLTGVLARAALVRGLYRFAYPVESRPQHLLRFARQVERLMHGIRARRRS